MKQYQFLFATAIALAISATNLHSSQAVGQERMTQVLDFESVNLGTDGYINGSDLQGASSININNFQFSNYFDNTWGPYWTGFAISNHTNTVIGDHTNQYSSFAGGGTDGSSNFAVGYMDSMLYNIDLSLASNLRSLPSIILPTGAQVQSLQITNTTYAASVIANGNQFTNPFGPGDYFDISVYGLDADNKIIAPVTHRLADYVSATTSSDGWILSQWETMNLQNLSKAASLHFLVTTTDTEELWTNTPMYFAIDSLSYSSVPEPSSMVLCSLLLVGGYAARRRREIRAIKSV